MTISTRLSLWPTGQVLLTAILLLAACPTAQADAPRLNVMDDDGRLQGAFVSVDLHASILSDAADKALLSGTFGYAVRGGYRWNSWGVFAQFEHNLWLATEQSVEVVSGVFNIGVGVDVTYARGFVRSSLVVGPSILSFDSALDDAGTTGVFFELRPVGLRWVVHENIMVGLDPISFALIMPVLSGIPIVEPQYRTTFTVEGLF
ncbi:MAG: hypothetical protein ACI9OJ_004652 [Myxococcota bacterium]|jgi:hypothetical protein